MSSSTVNIEAADGGHLPAYLAMPSRRAAPALVVLQEIFGVNANVKSIVDAYADKGFITIAPDMFWRQSPGIQLNPASEQDRATATGLMKSLDVTLAVKDAIAAMAYVRKRSEANGKVGAVGFCLGGKLAYLLAARSNVDAAVSYYGTGIQSALEEAPNIRAHLLLHIAAEDHLCPPEAQAQIARALAPLADRVRIETYTGVGHAFARRGGTGFNEAMATRANSSTLAFLNSHLDAATKDGSNA
jgi:carboxymethylenebutenolidase